MTYRRFLLATLILPLAISPLFARGDDPAEGFENRRNLTTIYDGWEQVRTENHPPYNTIEVVRSRTDAHSDAHYLALRTQGQFTC